MDSIRIYKRLLRTHQGKITQKSPRNHQIWWENHLEITCCSLLQHSTGTGAHSTRWAPSCGWAWRTSSSSHVASKPPFFPGKNASFNKFLTGEMDDHGMFFGISSDSNDLGEGWSLMRLGIRHWNSRALGHWDALVLAYQVQFHHRYPSFKDIKSWHQWHLKSTHIPKDWFYVMILCL